MDLAMKIHEWVASIAEENEIPYRTLKNSLSKAPSK